MNILVITVPFKPGKFLVTSGLAVLMVFRNLGVSVPPASPMGAAPHPPPAQHMKTLGGTAVRESKSGLPKGKCDL